MSTLRTHQLGYSYFLDDGKMVYAHRAAAERMLGRKLESREVVHHKDEDKANNHPGNLMVFKTNADHARFHKLADDEREVLLLADGAYICRRIAPKNKCQHCGNPFIKSHYRKDNREQVYCSKTCASLAREQSSVKPTKEELTQLLMANSYLAIGKKYGVTDNAVRKWCKSFDLPERAPELKVWRQKQQS